MSGITRSYKVVVPYKDLEKQIYYLNEKNAYVTYAEPVDKDDEKSGWSVYWSKSCFIETLRQEVNESEKLAERSISTIESEEDTGSDAEVPSTKTKKISCFIKHFFKKVHP